MAKLGDLEFEVLLRRKGSDDVTVVGEISVPLEISYLKPRANGPHSRACGIHCQGHGPACHQSCPTCFGKDVV